MHARHRRHRCSVREQEGYRDTNRLRGVATIRGTPGDQLVQGTEDGWSGSPLLKPRNEHVTDTPRTLHAWSCVVMLLSRRRCAEVPLITLAEISR